MKTIKLKITGYNPEKKFVVLTYNGKKGTKWYNSFNQDFLDKVQNELVHDDIGEQKGVLDIETKFTGTVEEDENGYLVFTGKFSM